MLLLARPILTPKSVLPLFFIIGVVFAPIGGVLICASSQVCSFPSIRTSPLVSGLTMRPRSKKSRSITANANPPPRVIGGTPSPAERSPTLSSPRRRRRSHGRNIPTRLGLSPAGSNSKSWMIWARPSTCTIASPISIRTTVDMFSPWISNS